MLYVRQPSGVDILSFLFTSLNCLVLGRPTLQDTDLQFCQVPIAIQWWAWEHELELIGVRRNIRKCMNIYG